FVLVGQHVLKVELHVLHVDAERLQLAAGHFLILFRGVQQRLRRDAAHVEAGAAQRPALFNTGHLQAILRGPNRGHVTARTCTNYNHVKVIRHVQILAQPVIAGTAAVVHRPVGLLKRARVAPAPSADPRTASATVFCNRFAYGTAASESLPRSTATPGMAKWLCAPSCRFSAGSRLPKKKRPACLARPDAAPRSGVGFSYIFSARKNP